VLKGKPENLSATAVWDRIMQLPHRDAVADLAHLKIKRFKKEQSP
jgi:hypothetical protein